MYTRQWSTLAPFCRARFSPLFTLGFVAAMVTLGCGSSSSTSGTGASGNLIKNGNAEAAVGSTGEGPVKTPDWTSKGAATAVQYGPSGIGYPVPGAPDAGKNLFSGGDDDATSSLTQTINVTQYASFIDGGGVTYVLQGWLGGYSGQGDDLTVTATFESSSGAALGKAVIGPVTAAERKDVTELLKRSMMGIVPPDTRSVVVVQSMTRTDGAYNDGYSDDLSLVFTGI
jgi:hypothetical protein